METIRAKLYAPFDPASSSIHDFLSSHVRCHSILASNGQVISDGEQISFLKNALIPCGLYAPCFITYAAIYPTLATQTFANFSEIVRNYDVPSTAIAAQLGYGHPFNNFANAATTITPYSTSFNNNKDHQQQRNNDLFCWTHGCVGHASAQCKNPAVGHMKDATIHNPKNSPAFTNLIGQVLNNNRRRRNQQKNNNRNKTTPQAAAAIVVTPTTTNTITPN